MGIFNNDGVNPTCPMPTRLVPNAPEKILGNYTFHQFNIILSGICTAVSCVVIFSLMALHAMCLSKPNEQIKIMRIAILLPSYSICPFISICFPNAYVYLDGYIEVLQGYALYSFHMLLCEFPAPNGSQRAYFASLRIPKSKEPQTIVDGLTWFRTIWYMCRYSSMYNRGKRCLLPGKPQQTLCSSLSIIQSASVGMAVVGILGFYCNRKAKMQKHKPLIKLLAFKLFVGVAFLEQIIFMILRSQNVPKPSATMSYADVVIGLPTMIICVQMFPLSFFFHFAYPTKPYTLSRNTGFQRSQQYHAVYEIESGQSHQQKRYQGGPLGLYAWFATLNRLKVFREIKSTLLMLREPPVGSADGAATTNL